MVTQSAPIVCIKYKKFMLEPESDQLAKSKRAFLKRIFCIALSIFFCLTGFGMMEMGKIFQPKKILVLSGFVLVLFSAFGIFCSTQGNAT